MYVEIYGCLSSFLDNSPDRVLEDLTGISPNNVGGWLLEFDKRSIVLPKDTIMSIIEEEGDE